MNLRTLRSFLVLAEELNFSRAAERLNIAQPALSQQIKQIETRLGFVLFERSTRPLRLTEAGLYFRNEVQQLMQSYGSAVAFAQKIDAGHRGWFGVGFTRSSMYSVLPAALSRFVEQFPDVELKLHEINLSDEQAEALHHRRIHIGIARDFAGTTGVVLEDLLKERLLVALPHRHRLAACPEIGLPELAGEPFILFPDHANARFPRKIMSICEAAGFVPRIAHRVHEIHTAIGLVGAGLGVTMVAASVARHRRDDLVFRPITVDGMQPVSVLQALYRADESQPQLAPMLEILRTVGKAFESPYPL